MIIAKIDVKKIDKSKLYQGTKGLYLDVCLIESPNSAYGDDYMVTQSVSKEDRDKGVKGAILGNAKIMGQRNSSPQSRAPAQPSSEPRFADAPKASGPAENLDEDVPF